jgi:hypothetical protein
MNLKQVLKKLWHCEQGFVVSNELVLMSAIVVIGLIVGMATVRDQVVQEFGDTSVSVGAMNQSFSFAGVVSPVGSSPGSAFDDSADFCEVFGFDPVNASPACININEAVHPPVF